MFGLMQTKTHRIEVAKWQALLNNRELLHDRIVTELKAKLQTSEFTVDNHRRELIAVKNDNSSLRGKLMAEAHESRKPS